MKVRKSRASGYSNGLNLTLSPNEVAYLRESMLLSQSEAAKNKEYRYCIPKFLKATAGYNNTGNRDDYSQFEVDK